ncbi:hypothetical protein [Chryseobacterium gambrini]|uniref:Uncharacterized protein n=1 Tax=Chryseobacterium gambrini TaxID=373672 RepID=A0ABM8KBH0_9FLAO|nr:hypothetical protein CRDW_37710 [Chryseobacterium gambrini]
MNSFYKSIGLYESLNFDIEMKQSELVESLRKITYKTNPSFISLIPDYGIPTRFEYRGMVNQKNFTIKRRRHFFDFNIMHCIIKGSISEENNKTLLTIEFIPFLYHFMIMVVSIVFALCIAFLASKDEKNYFILVVPFLMMIVQYFVLKGSIQRDKYDFLRELNFITQKNNVFKNTR